MDVPKSHARQSCTTEWEEELAFGGCFLGASGGETLELAFGGCLLGTSGKMQAWDGDETSSAAGYLCWANRVAGEMGTELCPGAVCSAVHGSLSRAQVGAHGP